MPPTPVPYYGVPYSHTVLMDSTHNSSQAYAPLLPYLGVDFFTVTPT